MPLVIYALSAGTIISYTSFIWFTHGSNLFFYGNLIPKVAKRYKMHLILINFIIIMRNRFPLNAPRGNTLVSLWKSKAKISSKINEIFRSWFWLHPFYFFIFPFYLDLIYSHFIFDIQSLINMSSVLLIHQYLNFSFYFVFLGLFCMCCFSLICTSLI